MARRSIFVGLVAAVAGAFPVTALAATAPGAPVLTSAPYAFPALLHWTPANDPLNLSQSVYRATGACTNPAAAGGLIMTFAGNATTDYAARPVDGTYCYHIKVADLLTTADGPGLTVTVDTVNPTATVAVSQPGPLSGTVTVSGTSADATSGVASSALHVGPVGACATGPVLIGGTWNTTAAPNGAYDVCNVVTDNAGHPATATLTVTVANLQSQALATPAPVVTPATGGPAAPPAAGADKVAPHAPTKLAAVLPRSKAGTGPIPVTIHWLNPAVADFDRVVAVLNLKRAPRGPADGAVVYQGTATTAGLKLRPGQKGRLALFAFDHAGNMSGAARKTVSLPPLSPLRPLPGTVVPAAPRLSWKGKKGSEYYNVQLFHNGKRVLVDWPTTASYRIPSAKLEPGTYVWFVWPAVKHKGAATTFGALIGRATFIYRA